MRSRVQSSSASTFEIFNVDRLRDVISNANWNSGRPGSMGSPDHRN